MRLTADLIHNSLSYINPLKERELDLRGHKIPAIENLGAARDQDCLDLTDNAITTLANLPFSPRLHTLLLARNRITTISPSLHTSAPNLTTLVLTANRLAQLADLDPLASLPKLTHLVLLETPVARKQHYRAWLLWRCRSLRFLDFVKVREAERTQAIELFGADAKHMTPLAREIAQLKSTGAAALADDAADGVNGDDAGASNLGRVKLSAKERKRVESMIRNAKSLSEIAQLEKALNEGRVPGGIVEDDDDEEMEGA